MRNIDAYDEGSLVLMTVVGLDFGGAHGSPMSLGGRVGCFSTCGFPKMRGTLLGVPQTRIILFWGKNGVPILGNYHLCNRERTWTYTRLVQVAHIIDVALSQ